MISYTAARGGHSYLQQYYEGVPAGENIPHGGVYYASHPPAGWAIAKIDALELEYLDSGTFKSDVPIAGVAD